MNLKQIEAFVHIAEGKSFSKAAKELYLTQPTISAHISSLEKALNTRLFIRNTKEVRLSEGGEKLYPYAVQMVELQKQIEESFGKIGVEKKACIRIAASSINSQYILPNLMIKFCEVHQGENFEVMETDSLGVVEAVVNRNADIGFVGTKIAKKNCKYIPFYKDRLVIIAPNNEKYRNLRQKELLDIEWILDEKIIMREQGSGTRTEMERQLMEEGVALERLKVVASMDNSEVIKASVMKGMGISMMSSLAVEDEVKSGKIVTFQLGKSNNDRSLYVVYNKSFQLNGSAKRFLDVLNSCFKEKKASGSVKS